MLSGTTSARWTASARPPRRTRPGCSCRHEGPAGRPRREHPSRESGTISQRARLGRAPLPRSARPTCPHELRDATVYGGPALESPDASIEVITLEDADPELLGWRARAGH